MLPAQFYAEIAHFSLYIFAALVNFAIAWLIFDAWSAKKPRKELFKWLGFLALSFSFLITSLIVQSTEDSSNLSENIETIGFVVRDIGYALIIIGLTLDPLLKAPRTGLAIFGVGAHLLTPVLALSSGVLYLRKAFQGLEKHLKPLGFYFVLLTVFELVNLSDLVDLGSHTSLIQFLEFPGPIWIFNQFILLAALVVATSWVWQYLTERFQTQLFMIFTTGIVAIFLITSIAFTSALMLNLTNASLDNLQQSSKLLNYTLTEKKAETLSSAQGLSSRSDVVSAASKSDHQALVDLGGKLLQDQKGSTLTITGSEGQVLYRADDPSKWGDSLSDDTKVKRALLGKSSSSMDTKDSVLAPLIYINSTSAILDGSNHIVGSLTYGVLADNALLDSIKSVTGLDMTLFSGDTRSATTLTDGNSRLVGTKEKNSSLDQTVLKQGHEYRGNTSVLNTPYLVSVSPILDNDNSVIGMVSVGQSEASILSTASRSIGLTFLLAVVLLIISVIPSYFISRYLAYQLA